MADEEKEKEKTWLFKDEDSGKEYKLKRITAGKLLALIDLAKGNQGMLMTSIIQASLVEPMGYLEVQELDGPLYMGLNTFIGETVLEGDVEVIDSLTMKDTLTGRIYKIEKLKGRHIENAFSIDGSNSERVFSLVCQSLKEPKLNVAEMKELPSNIYFGLVRLNKLDVLNKFRRGVK